jgi:rhodanese-related sulfurtransferase
MTYRLFTLLLPLTLLLACGDSSSSQGAADDASMQYQDLSVEEFAGKIGSENTILLDVRTPAETANGVIEGAIELDYQSPSFQEELAKLDQSKTFLVDCAVGGRSGKTCQMLKAAGVKEVYNLEGGYKAWKE